jgi:hypothetical protein
MGLPPQLPHNNVVYPLGGNQFRVTFESLANKSSGNMGRTSTNAHTQNKNIVKPFMNVLLECSEVSMWR